MNKPKPQVMIVGDKEWHCTCSPCYNCRVNAHKLEVEGGPSAADKNAAASLAPVIAAKEYRASIESERATDTVTLAPLDDEAEEVMAREILRINRELARPTATIIDMPEGDPMERMVCDSCQ